MNATARIILLNGVGSAGKTSIAKALQAVAGDPFLHVQMDTFIAMLPEAWQERPETFAYETVLENGKPSVVITLGPVGERTLRGISTTTAPRVPSVQAKRTPASGPCP